jgi:hypothetical protein
MSEVGNRLSGRRESLTMRSGVERQRLAATLDDIAGAAQRIDRGLDVVRRLATPPVLVAGGVAAALLLRRGGVRRAVAGGVALLGLFLRARSTSAKVLELVRGQAVRRSR